MGRRHDHGTVRKNSLKTSEFPKVFYDPNLNYASVKLAAGVEARSYLKDGFIFSENAAGKVIEIQILNPSQLRLKNRKAPRSK